MLNYQRVVCLKLTPFIDEVVMQTSFILNKKRFVNRDPTSKSCDFQAAVFIFMSRRLILNCLNYRACCIYIRAAISYIISISNPMAEKFDSVTGKINPCVEQIAIRSMTWNSARMESKGGG